MTQLRKRVLEELKRRNYSQATARAYVGAIGRFAEFFHRSPDQLGIEQVRQYQVHLFADKKLAPHTVMVQMCALRFLYLKVLRRPFRRDDLPLPKTPKRLPVVLSPEETERLIEGAVNLRHRTILMTLYATGLRRAEICRLQLHDIDSARMMIHVREGKGRKDRDIPLSEKRLPLGLVQVGISESAWPGYESAGGARVAYRYVEITPGNAGNGRSVTRERPLGKSP